MSTPKEDERRRYKRYETDMQMQFYVSFDIETKIDFRVKEPGQLQFSPEKYSATSQNVSVEGLCFFTEKKLNRGDCLSVELYVPSSPKPVLMEGTVRWLLPVPAKDGAERFCAGVQLVSVSGQSVEQSIFIDHIHQVVWSVVLESVFGTFKQLALEMKKAKEKGKA